MIPPFDSVMVRVLLRPLLVVIQVFALYTLLHGHYSPGGGFQAGVLFGASMILPILVHGDANARGVPSPRAALAMGAVGVLLYAGLGAAPLSFGHALLDYAGVPLDGLGPASRRAYGILGIETGVTLAVAGVVVSILHTLNADS